MNINNIQHKKKALDFITTQLWYTIGYPEFLGITMQNKCIGSFVNASRNNI